MRAPPALRPLCAGAAAAFFCLCAVQPGMGAPPDAPEPRPPADAPSPGSYRDAVASWTSAEEISAWIGAHFTYDRERALELSEPREGQSRPEIIEPERFFDAPKGVCIDLARFGVETLRKVEPASRARYLMIEFVPATVGGHVFRRHWTAAFEKDEGTFFFADSKRPGLVAGPYGSAEDFIREYEDFRDRKIVGFKLLDSYRRRRRAARKKTRAR